MQEHALVLRGDAKQGARLLGVTALQIAQDDYCPLPRWQALDRSHDIVAQLTASHDALGTDLIPKPRCLDPVSIRFELRAVDSPAALAGSFHERRQSHESPFSAGTRAGSVQHNAEDPGGQA